MKILKAYKQELMPKGEQQRKMRRFAGSCRFVFNKGLALQKNRYEAGEKFLSYVDMAKHLTEWRNSRETSWLSESPVHPLQHALKDLERAYKNFFAKRADFPKFKKKGESESFRYPDSKQFKIDSANSRVFLPKLGWIRFRKSREIEGVAKNITVSFKGGKWYASIQTELEIEDVFHPSTSIVGVDLGVAKFATLSDGQFIRPVSAFKSLEKKLARAQRSLRHKKKFSNNWKKAKTRITRIHQRIGNVRRDYLHKSTSYISKNHAIVCIEDLQVRNMSKSAAGTLDSPGRNVNAKSGLNKSILDQGWHEFRRQLEYKQGWLGGQVLAVNPRNTSRTCPHCGHVSPMNRLTQSKFECVECGHAGNADWIAAQNILAAGHAVLACGGEVQLGLPVKQEPSEATLQEVTLV